MKLQMILIWVFVSITTTSLCQEISPEIFNPEIVYTQQEVDSILLYYRVNARKIKDYSDVKKILESDKKLRGWSYYYFLKSKQYNLTKVYDSSIVYANKGITYFNGLKNQRDFDEKIMLEIHLYKARSLNALKKDDESIKSNQKALDYTKKYPYRWKSFITAAIASCHLEIGNDSIALGYYLENTKDSLYMTLDRSAVATYERIGKIYAYSNDLKSAQKYFVKGVNRSMLGSYKDNLWVLYYDLGYVSKRNKSTDSVLYFHKKAIKYFNNKIFTQTPPEYILSYLNSYVELYEGDANKAIIQLNRILDTYKGKKKFTKTDKELIVNVFDALVIGYKKQGNLDGLGKVQKESSAFLEKFYENQLKINLDNLEVKYQSKEKDTSIAVLEETTKNQQTIISQRNIINWVLGGLLMSFIGLGYLFYRQRRLQNQYKTSNLEQRLLRSQLNPHFLFNALNSVSGLVQKKSDHTIPYISKLGELLRSILENSREEFISLQEELETIATYLELQSNFSKKFTFEIQVDKGLDKDELLIPPMFLQPFIENAIDHGFKGNEDEKITITVVQKPKNQVLYFSIEDNGIGYSNTMKNKKDVLGHQSLSGTILKERLALYARAFKKKARYVIGDVDAGRGTRVELWLPYLIED
jgi:hypothetical protein